MIILNKKKLSIEFNSLFNYTDSNNSNKAINNIPSSIQKSLLNTNNINNKINNGLFDSLENNSNEKKLLIKKRILINNMEELIKYIIKAKENNN